METENKSTRQVNDALLCAGELYHDLRLAQAQLANVNFRYETVVSQLEIANAQVTGLQAQVEKLQKPTTKKKKGGKK